MTPRKRNKGNRKLPPNLYAKTVGDVTYYRYRHPGTRKEHSMGQDMAKAVNAAKILNARLMGGADLVARVVDANGFALSAVAAQFRVDMIDKHPKLTDGSKANKGYKLDRIVADLGEANIQTMRTLDITRFLEQFARDPYKQHRLVLEQLFNFAISRGYFEGANPVTPTPATDIHDKGKERRRLTLKQYKAIHAIAPDWFQVAMDLALHLAQGRSEVARMQFSDIRDGVLYVVRQKTQTKEHARLAIRLSSAATKVIRRAKALPPIDRHIVHYNQPRRPTNGVTPDNITKTFQRLRDKTELFDGVAPRARPTFHEIRALSSHLMEAQGVSKEQIQAIMAHADAATTEIYLGDHAEKWVQVAAPDIAV